MQIQMGMYALMQKKIEKEEFDKIMKEHSKWLENHETGKRANLSDRDLTEMDLSGKDLSYANMEGVCLQDAKLIGANLSNASLRQAFLHGADLTGADLENTIFFNARMTMAKLNECKGNKARFIFSCMWDCDIKNATLTNASFLDAEICDSDFTGSNLENSSFTGADMDNAVFADTNLKNVNFDFARRTYWCDFTNADMTGVRLLDVDIDPENLDGVKGLYLHPYCPEEGAFIAWKKCREGKVVKLLIPECAKRKGYSVFSCRASEAVVLEIYDQDGNPVDEAISIIDENFKYVKGETAVAESVDSRHYGDTTGIYFVLSREETKFYHEKKEKEDDNEEDDIAEE